MGDFYVAMRKQWTIKIQMDFFFFFFAIFGVLFFVAPQSVELWGAERRKAVFLEGGALRELELGWRRRVESLLGTG